MLMALELAAAVRAGGVCNDCVARLERPPIDLSRSSLGERL